MAIDEQFRPFVQRMREADLPEIIIHIFKHYYAQLTAGKTGFIPEAKIEPVTDLPNTETFPPRLADIGQAALPKAVLLKLNGGLGTSMGLDKAKSLLTVKDSLTFLDIIAHQAEEASVPLVLMDSFATRDDSLTLLKNYPDLGGGIPLDFVQHKVPKVAQADLSPINWPADPELEWCPPGHGDIYAALVTSGMLDHLLQAGYEYAFVSNSDNLGAVIDPAILGYFADQQLPFMMEVADRTEADKKGGHLAQRLEGQLILRESAQCPAEDMPTFQDIKRHKYFNTNNLWLNLPALKQVMTSRDNILGLPMIRNAKTVDPRDMGSPPVYQLETAMGSAIAVFEGARAVRVPRRRFAPVKTTEDLLAVRSDIYTITDDFRVVPQLPDQQTITINLDPVYYKFITDLETRFPYGIPSLIDCQRLTIKGDVRFGENVILRGEVTLINESVEPVTIPTGTVLQGNHQW